VQERQATQTAFDKQLEQTILWLKESGHHDTEESLLRLERERDRWRRLDLASIEPNEMRIYQQHCLTLIQESITHEQRERYEKPNIELIDDCIESIPWAKVSSYVTRELASAQKKAKRLSERLDAGVVEGVHEELIVLGKQMRELIRLNRRASSAKMTWDTYHANLETVSLRLRKLSEFGEVDVLDREGDAAWESGDFELAQTKYQQALHALDLFLAKHESTAEKAARVALLSQSDFRAVAQLREQLSQTTSERDQLAEQVSELQDECQLFTEYLATRVGSSSKVLVAAPDERESKASGTSVAGRSGGDETPPQ
ncbi:MAG: hypothetical protein ACK5OB_02820, partial [Pirellula sp.]